MHDCYFNLMLASLAVWRVTHLFAKEDGPFDLIYGIRKLAGNGFFGKLLDCFYCTSVWVALPAACWLGIGWQQKLLYWAALSGAACLLEQATAREMHKENVQEYKED